MKVEINLRAYPEDEVWLALKGGPYKATVESVTTHIPHSRLDFVYQGGRYTRYNVLLEDGRREGVYNIAIFHTKEEAQKRLEGLNKLGWYTKELSEAILCEREKNPDVVLIDEKQDFKEFVSLVKRMREAQTVERKWGIVNFKTEEDKVACGEAIRRMYQLEQKVDEYLKEE
jgi:hypothetical protein